MSHKLFARYMAINDEYYNMVIITILEPIYLPLDQLDSQNINPPFQGNDIVLKINSAF